MIHPALPPVPKGKYSLNLREKNGARKKSQTKFGISPFISPQMLPTHKPPSVSDVSDVFIVPSFSPAPNPRKGQGWWGAGRMRINALQMCLSPLAWIKDFSSIVHIFQAESLPAQECHMAVRSGLLFCCPFYVKPKLLYSDVKLDRCVLGSLHAENTWQTESPWSPWSNCSQ